MSETRTSPRVVRFGAFEVDLRAGELRKHGIRIKLQEQPLQVLGILLERPGDVVTREELRTKLWPADTFVDFDHGLNSAINKLREALGDSADNPRFIETLPRRGYRFIGAVELPARQTEIARPAEAGSGQVPSPRIPQEVALAQDADRGLSLDTAGTPSTGALAREAPIAPGTGVATAAPKPRSRYVLLGMATAAAVVAVIIGLNIGGVHQRLFGKPTTAKIQSIAVLPLENLSRDPEQEYFADGMTDEMIAELAKISALRVISRTSVMQYKGTKKPLPEIARELNVDALVEGTVLRSGDRVRVTANLVQAVPERHLWAQGYERDLRDVLALQSDVASAIAREIRVKLTPSEQERLVAHREVNPEAHETYLKGRYYWNKRSEEGLRRAIEYFSEATEKDRNYALAHAGLADSYIVLGEYGLLPPKEAYAKARAAATKALELDDTLGEAHNALAVMKGDYDWDWPGAEREFRRAIGLNSSYSTAHQWYGELLSALGRHEEALAEIKRAQQLDPLSLIINTASGRTLLYAGRDDLAIEQLQKTLEIDPYFGHAHFILGFAYLRKGALAEAIAEFQRATTLSPTVTLYKAALGNAYARAGKSAEARKLLDELKEQSKRRYVSWSDFAYVYAGLGDKDQAFASLEKAYEQRVIKWWNRSPLLDPLYSDPRFQELLRRIGFPE